jgi:hypothetical protein
VALTVLGAGLATVGLLLAPPADLLDDRAGGPAEVTGSDD